jgi:DNA-directed RNA polymerase specialized sigma subunit
LIKLFYYERGGASMTNEELAQRIQAGEHNLMAALWEQNTGIITLSALSLYNQYRERCASAGVELDDIIQISYFALCDAVQAYKPDRGYKLTSYYRYPLKNHFMALIGVRKSKRDALNQGDSLNRPITGDDDIT